MSRAGARPGGVAAPSGAATGVRARCSGTVVALGLVDELAPEFDFAVNEQCHEFGECDVLQPFLDASKPVLNTEYVMPDTSASAKRELTTICTAAQSAGTTTLILPLALDDSYRAACPPSS